MNYAKIIFTNGDELAVNEETIFSGIRKKPNDLTYPQVGLDDYHELQFPYLASNIQGIQIQYHSHAGLIPSITEILMNYDFFSVADHDNDFVYSSSSVFKIVNL